MQHRFARSPGLHVSFHPIVRLLPRPARQHSNTNSRLDLLLLPTLFVTHACHAYVLVAAALEGKDRTHTCTHSKLWADTSTPSARHKATLPSFGPASATMAMTPSLLTKGYGR